jgi:hypothetical protein
MLLLVVVDDTAGVLDPAVVVDVTTADAVN